MGAWGRGSSGVKVVVGARGAGGEVVVGAWGER